MKISKKLFDTSYSNKSFLNQNSFVVYGLGLTGKSAINLFKKKKVKFFIWDDDPVKRFLFGLEKRYKNIYFEQILDRVDWIILSPGINIEKSKFSKKLIQNKSKIITDLDLFYILNKKIKSIVVTGSNGKSTTCKIIEHIFKKNDIKVKLGGNIGKPILNLKFKKNTTIIIEASSFQLSYSKFVRPKYAIILNITNDHLDRHRTMKKYTESKFKIFLNQKKEDFAFLNNKKFINLYKKNNFKGQLQLISIKKYLNVRNKIKNNYLKSKINDENMSFVYGLSKKFNIKNNLLIKSLDSFKGLEHRHEIFYQNNNIKLINDSKATSFEASKYALMSNENIYWIVGGIPKKNDFFDLKKVKKKIIRAYVIGKKTEFFIKQIKKKIDYVVSNNLEDAINNIFNDIKFSSFNKNTVLLSPAAASYDQFKNFEDRGFNFKQLCNKNIKKLTYV